MKYDFDTIIDRRGTDAVKLRQLKTLFGRDDLGFMGSRHGV